MLKFKEVPTKAILKVSLTIPALLLLMLVKGCSDDYYTESDFKSINKIDTHMHLHATSTVLSELAKEDNFRLLDVMVDVPDYPPIEEQERYALHQVNAFPEQVNYLTAFTLVKWDSAGWADRTIVQLKTSFNNGALGIKLWKNIGMVYKDSSDNFIMIDDSRLDPVIQYVIDQNKTVMGHLGEPKNCWLPIEQMTVKGDKEYFKNNPEYHMFLHPEYPSYEDQINARDRFIGKHPDMRFVGAHLGSLEYNVDSLAKRLDKFPNMAVDMAARISHLQFQSKINREKVRNFIIKYQDRLIYATDSGISTTSVPEESKTELHRRWLNDWKYFATDQAMTVDEVEGELQGLKLPKVVIDNIYHNNAVKWFNIKI